MRKPFLHVSLVITAAISLFLASCKSGPKDSDIEKSVNEKAAVVASDVSGFGTTVKDGVVTLNGQFKDAVSKDAFETTVKAIPGVKSIVNNSTVVAPAPPPAAVEISADDALIKGLADVTKNFPGVKADVKDGVVTLTGEIKRSSLPKLMAGVSSLKPKKIEQKLTVK